MADIYQVADDYKRRLRRREAQALREIQTAYDVTQRRVLEELLSLMLAAQRYEPGNWRRAALSRLAELEQTLGREGARFGRAAGRAVEAGQAQAVDLGVRGASAMAEAGPLLGVRWARVPAEALEHLVGTLGNGSPLRELFDRFGPVASTQGREALEAGLGAGWNPRKAAVELERALRSGEPPQGFGAELLGRTGELRDRALVIARTEMVRSHRQAALANYQANADVVEGWEWHAERGPRTCAVCLAMDGTLHPLDEPFASHVQCRCSPVPWFDGMDGRGEGEDWFAEQDEEYQEAVLGPGKLALYRDGKIQLRDLVHESRDPEWGPQRNEKSLKRVNRELGIEPGDRPKAPPNDGNGSTLHQVFPNVDLFGKNDASKQVEGLRKAIQAAGLKLPPWDGPTLKLRTGAKLDAGTAGHFVYGQEIALGRGHKRIWPNTMAHEFAHAIDAHVLSRGIGGYDWFSGGGTLVDAAFSKGRGSNRRFAAWAKAVTRTKRFKSLSVSPGEWESYLLSPKELWARTFAQYVTARSKDPGFAKSLEWMRSNPAWEATVWADDDFEPVARKMDALFKDLGWM